VHVQNLREWTKLGHSQTGNPDRLLTQRIDVDLINFENWIVATRLYTGLIIEGVVDG
jgi:hypothetical protein